MIETKADVTLPVTPDEAFAVITDLDHADWLPAVRRLRHMGGPKKGVGARYEVEVGFLGRHLRGVLVCKELKPPSRMVMVLEEGLDLKIAVSVRSVRGGCSVELTGQYSLGGGPFGRAMEVSSQGPARRETARAVEQLAARFGRRTGAGASR